MYAIFFSQSEQRNTFAPCFALSTRAWAPRSVSRVSDDHSSALRRGIMRKTAVLICWACYPAGFVYAFYSAYSYSGLYLLFAEWQIEFSASNSYSVPLTLAAVVAVFWLPARLAVWLLVASKPSGEPVSRNEDLNAAARPTLLRMAAATTLLGVLAVAVAGGAG